MKTTPWHSIKPNAPLVYHDNTECKTGNYIEKENRRPGSAGRRQCEECARLRELVTTKNL